MIETISLILFILAILFVALMAPKPSDKGPKPPSQNPKPPGRGPEPSGPEKKDPDSQGE
jgi:hypothetical protein